MQLILTQPDIEQALKNYVNEILTINDGMVITVDLKATRGPDGSTAVIDISPAKPETIAVVAERPAPKARAATAQVVKQEPVVVKPEPEVTQDPVATVVTEPEPEVELVVEDPIVDTTVAVEPEAESEAEPEAETGTEAATEAAPVKKTSLFAALTKPNNG